MTKKNPRDTEPARQAEQIDRDLNAIRRATRRPLNAEELRGHLTAPQRTVMQAVVHNEGVTLKDLAKKVHLAHSTVSGIVDRLSDRGMVARRDDPKDARVVRIYPTDEVRNFVINVLPMITRGPLEDALRRATHDERSSITASIQRLRELLDG